MENMNLRKKEGTMIAEELSAIPLMDVVFRFTDSKILIAAVELGLFTKLANGKGLDVRGVAYLLGVEERPARTLLVFCTALELLEKRGNLYYNSPRSEKFLVEGKPSYFGGFVTMVGQRLYPAWLGLEGAIKTNRPQTWRDKAGHFESIYSNPERMQIFLNGMHSLSIQSGRAVARAFDFSQRRQVLDVGGGSGAYCIALLDYYPHLRATIFDLPPALVIAEEKIAENKMANRIKTHAGDFFKGELPGGFDVHLLSMILHDWAPEDNLKILRGCFETLLPGGIIIISELMMDNDETGPLSAARMAANMLIENMGFNYTWDKYEEWLRQVGFQEIQRIPLESPAANGVLIGSKL